MAIQGGVTFTGLDGEVVESIAIEDGQFKLFWTFDVEDGITKMLEVNLTEDEARRVYERDRVHEGILEPVRATLTHREATIFSYQSLDKDRLPAFEDVGTATFEIPADGTELDFLDALDAVKTASLAERTQALTDEISHLEESLREARSNLQKAKAHKAQEEIRRQKTALRIRTRQHEAAKASFMSMRDTLALA